jgi:hypothetical protein
MTNIWWTKNLCPRLCSPSFAQQVHAAICFTTVSKGSASAQFQSGGGKEILRTSSRRASWTVAEHDILDAAINRGQQSREVYAMLPSRTPAAVDVRYRTRRYILYGAKYNKSSSDNALAMVAAAKKGSTINELMALWPHHTADSIRSKLRYHGVALSGISAKKARWTAEEEIIIEEGIKQGRTATDLKMHLDDRSLNAISDKLRKAVKRPSAKKKGHGLSRKRI